MRPLHSIQPRDLEGIRIKDFQKLMRLKIRDILLISSLYDLYLFEEDGRLYELIRQEFQVLNLSHPPEITHVTTGAEALEAMLSESPFDLIITTLHVEDMHVMEFARRVRQSGCDTPIVLLAYDNREYEELLRHYDTGIFERVFIWQGDYHLIIAIIKCLEDRLNVTNDTSTVGVQSIILVEDNVMFYSSYLPSIYAEILQQSQRLISEGMNIAHRFLRMRARPKILLSTTYEEAWSYYSRYADNVLGIISDIDFPRNGVHDPQAGIEFARAVKARHPDIAILLQSTTPDMEHGAHALGASYLLKDSPTLLHDLRQFMFRYFSFGDFIFRMPDGAEVGRATDLPSLEEQLGTVPEDSIRFHAERNHFSNWLKARTEFGLAHKLRPRKVADYSSTEALRQDLIVCLRGYRHTRQLGQLTEFSKTAFDPTSSFARIGGGSLGGKARGLGFANTLLNSYDIRDRFPEISITIPPAVVVATDVFDRFLADNDLRDFALRATDDAEITRRFLAARRFPRRIMRQLSDFIEIIHEPLAVRSSTLLEDSQFHPFAGVYATYMIPNSAPVPAVRLRDLVNTIKRVWASTFYQSARDYIKVTSYRLEEEKMAVIIQKMVGAPHGTRFYPDVCGVAKSYNFYPVPPQKPLDGIVSVALGLGKLIVDGGITVRFCPKYPGQSSPFASPLEILRNSQGDFYALDLNAAPLSGNDTRDSHVKRYPIPIAEEDGTLSYTASTYCLDSESIHEGLSRNGRRVITFAPILRSKLIPLPQIVDLLLDLGSWGMGTPVEIEFALNLSVPRGTPKQFGLLQIRPLVMSREPEEVNHIITDEKSILCRSNNALGHGVLKEIRDVVCVDISVFDRSKSEVVAREVSQFNQQLVAEHRPYLLIGVGRWGSLDHWLGIPVKWDQIAGAKAIVEAGFKDIDVQPSQGSHFFQNITSFMVSYFTVREDGAESFLDWEWLLSQPAFGRLQYTRHLKFQQPLIVRVNGETNQGVILKPT